MDFRLTPKAMTLDDLEHQNEGFFMDFWRFWVAKHNSRANCSKINGNKQERAASDIFSIKRRFRQSKSRFSSFKETCARGHQTESKVKSRYITAVNQSFAKAVADRHGHAAYHNKH